MCGLKMNPVINQDAVGCCPWFGSLNSVQKIDLCERQSIRIFVASLEVNVVKGHALVPSLDAWSPSQVCRRKVDDTSGLRMSPHFTSNAVDVAEVPVRIEDRLRDSYSGIYTSQT